MSRAEYEECLKRGKLNPFSRGKDLAPKELETAAADLERAEKTLTDGDYKWATVQLYYSMFHSARSLLYAKDLREHSHFCLTKAIRELYVESKQMPLHLIEALEHAKDLREDADYYDRWTKTGCEKMLQQSREFLDFAKKVIEDV
jgi:uncharacterized protein (UPF0332 family)